MGKGLDPLFITDIVKYLQLFSGIGAACAVGHANECRIKFSDPVHGLQHPRKGRILFRRKYLTG